MPRTFCPTDSLTSQPVHSARKEALRQMYSHGFKYSRKLTAHNSCVNCVTFSHNDGRWLASAGDDFRMHLWDFSQEDVRHPSHTLSGPVKNISVLNFSATNQYLYTGAEDVISKYDISLLGGTTSGLGDRGSSSFTEYQNHMNVVRALTCHPYEEEVFLSASEDASLMLHDGRAGNGTTAAQGIIEHDTKFTGVQYHPILEHFFASSDADGRVCLHDTRMAFGSSSTDSDQGIVRVYNTKLSKKSANYLCNPESSSLTFDRDGSKLAVIFVNYFPTIYALSDSHPLAICTSRNAPNGSPIPADERTYAHSFSSVRSGTFGGPGMDEDDMYGAGSDDFRCYLWKIPSLISLQGLRKEITADDWYTQEWPDIVAFTEGTGKRENRYVPFEIGTSLARLNGHQSVVNAVAIHPSLPYIATSGTEFKVLLHSPMPSSPAAQNLLPTSTRVRPLQSHNLQIPRALRALFEQNSILRDAVIEGSEKEQEIICMTDECLRIMGGKDVFAVRQIWDDETEETEVKDGDETMSDAFEN
ncbi:WD40 repeat-like protein [Rhizopogon salebrosus TDB-379]|nr:WD40 repeat-like protein [Rhizopogon salebrosus TDB-379]